MEINEVLGTSKLKKKSSLRFFDKKMFEKKIVSWYHNVCEISLVTDMHAYKHTHTHTHTHAETFFKNQFFSFLGSQNVLICQKIINQNFTYHTKIKKKIKKSDAFWEICIWKFSFFFPIFRLFLRFSQKYKARFGLGGEFYYLPLL